MSNPYLFRQENSRYLAWGEGHTAGEIEAKVKYTELVKALLSTELDHSFYPNDNYWNGWNGALDTLIERLASLGHSQKESSAKLTSDYGLPSGAAQREISDSE